MYYIFINGIYQENTDEGLTFDQVNADLKIRIKNEYVNLDDALLKGFINPSEYSELNNDYFCWDYTGSNYQYEYLKASYKNPDGSLKVGIFAYNDKQSVKDHFKDLYRNGDDFLFLNEIIANGFVTQDEIKEMNVLRAENNAIFEAKEQKIIEDKKIRSTETREYIFAALFDTNGIISDGGRGFNLSYDNVNKSFTCVIPESVRDHFPMEGENPKYYLDIKPDAISGFRWDRVKRKENFEIFQVDNNGNRHSLEDITIEVHAYYHKDAL